VAGRIADNVEFFRDRLVAQPRHFLSLRRAARVLGVSTQPLRDWVQLGHLKRDGPRKQFSKTELERFLTWLESRAEPLPEDHYVKRLWGKRGKPPLEFTCLRHARFVWPKGREALTPKALAELVGCHPSLIIKAIRHYAGWSKLGQRRTPKRWEITKRKWSSVFYGTVVTKPRMPPIPQQPRFTTNEVAWVLREWGFRKVSLAQVRRMIASGQLEGVPPPPGKRRWYVTRKSLEKMRRTLLTR
jgi:hypothetical protein